MHGGTTRGRLSQKWKNLKSGEKPKDNPRKKRASAQKKKTRKVMTKKGEHTQTENKTGGGKKGT